MMFELIKAVLRVAGELHNIHIDLELLIRDKIKDGGTSETN